MNRTAVIIGIISHAIEQSENGDYNIEGDDMIKNAVVNSANTLKYFLTKKLKNYTIVELEYEV